MRARRLLAAGLLAACLAGGATPVVAAADPLRARTAMQVELQKYGLSSDEARAHVAGLSDDEVADLARNLTGFSSPREIAAFTGSAVLGLVVAAWAMRRTRQEVPPAGR